jgi:hypothetical protein
LAKRKPFLLRLDPRILAALQGWAKDDLRSLNAQLEYLLRQSLRNAGRLPSQDEGSEAAQTGDSTKDS